MVVKIRKLGSEGHKTLKLSEEEAQEMLDADVGRYFIRNNQTGKIVREIKVRKGQDLTMIPIVAGG